MNTRWTMLVGMVVMGFGACSLGCYATAGTYVASESAVVYDASPELVAVEPGIWVVSHQPTTIYYVNDTYWTCRDNRWYRSSSWNGGWISADVNIVPFAIVHRRSRPYVNDDHSRQAAARALPPGHQVFPGVRHGPTEEHHHVRRNEMGSTWSGRGGKKR